MPNPEHMIETKTLQIAGGISKQPAHERFPGQLEDANNATFAIVDGGSKRPGSILVAKLTNANPSGGPDFSTGTGSIYKLHPINRDANEKYLVVYAINVLRVFHVDGTEAGTLGSSAIAGTYYAMNNATADQLRFVSIADYTIIANTTVSLGVTTTPSFAVTAEWPTYEQMVAHTPTSLPGSTSINISGDLTYHKTNNDSAAEPAGYYQYSVSGNTFPTIQFAPVTAGSGGVASDWASTTVRGFRIRFEKRQDAFTGATLTHAGPGTPRTLTAATNVWASYSHQSGDQFYNTAGTGFVAGWYPIIRKAAANQLIIDSSMPGTSGATNFAGAGIGQEYRVQFPGTGGQLPSMHDVAQFLQDRLQGAGAVDALIEWTDTASDTGYFTITAPWRGGGSKVTVVTTNPSAPGGGVFDITAAGQPLNPTGAVLVLGGGSGPRTLPFNQRWTRVAAPGDADGSIDQSKAPIKMIRAVAAKSGSINNVTAASPTVLTATAAHGLTTGQTVTLSGLGVTTAPPGGINGIRYVVQVLSPTTFALYTNSAFTTPINVTVAVGPFAGSFASGALYTYDMIPWKNRTSGSDATNPTPSVFKSGATIADVGFFQQRFSIAAGEHVLMSATNDLFRFYLDDANNLVDSDPIDAPLSSDRVTILDRIVPVRDTLYVTTLAGVQHALASQGPLTPSSVAFPRATTMQTLRTAPEVLDPTVYVATASGGKSQLREAFFVDQQVPTDAADVSAHVSGTAIDAGLLPASVQTITGHANSRTVFLLPAPGANVIYLYKAFWSGPRKEQSAWSVWTFNSGTRISDIKVIDDFLYLLVEHYDGTTRQFAIEKVPMFEPALTGSCPYTIHLDRQVPMASGTGVFGAGVTTWTLPNGLSDSTLNAAVITSGGSAGTQLTLASGGGGTTVIATGDYSGVNVVIGRTYQFSLKLTEPYPTDLNAKVDYLRTPQLGLKMLQNRMDIVHASSGAYDVVAAFETGTTGAYTQTFSFAPASGFTERAGKFCAWASGDLSRATVTIQSSAATPVTICSFSQRGDWAAREYGP